MSWCGNGIKPVVFDKFIQRLVGLLTFGIPEFKIGEKSVMTRRREIFEEMGR